MIEHCKNGVRLHLWIQPGASKSEIIGPYNNCLKIKIAAPPVDGKANDEIIAFLSQKLKIPKKNIEILRGETGRKKCVEINDLDPDDLKKILNL
jgi:uncharacterized protein (TIGR00251 family)